MLLNVESMQPMTSGMVMYPLSCAWKRMAIGGRRLRVFFRVLLLCFPSCSQAIPKPKNVAPQHVPGEVCGKGHHGKGSCPRVS